MMAGYYTHLGRGKAIKNSYYKLNETTGDAIDYGNNGVNATLEGGVTRDGMYYSYVDKDSYVKAPDLDVYNLQNNKDFIIKTNVIFQEVGPTWQRNDANLINKRILASFPSQEWDLVYESGGFRFSIWDNTNNPYTVEYLFTRVLEQEYVVGASYIGGILKLFLDGIVVSSLSIPSNVAFNNAGNSFVTIGATPFKTQSPLMGKQREVFIQKGEGWTDQQIIDNYNNNGIVTL